VPIGDWQFWIVTLLALCAAGYLLRNLLPIPFFTRRAKRKKHQRSATLTISAKPRDKAGAGRGEEPPNRTSSPPG
jgi:hypothetical protein